MNKTGKFKKNKYRTSKYKYQAILEKVATMAI